MIASHTESRPRAARRGWALATLSWLLLQPALGATDGARPASFQASPAVVTDWNATFVDNAGPSGTVGAFAVWDDGSGEALYAGANNNSTTGGFKTAGGLAMQWIGRWNGSSWSALGSGLDGPVTAMVAFGDELVVSGLFSTAGGVPIANRLARWNGLRWLPFEGAMRNVSSLVVHNGELYASGGFVHPDGTSNFAVARWNGVEWTELGSGWGSIISVLAIHDGHLVAGGNFSSVDGQTIRKVARWNGTQWEPIGNGLPGWVMELTEHQGDLVAGGIFTLDSGSSSTRAARWDGSTWIPLGNLTRVDALASFNGELIAGTSGFHGGVVRWDGSAWVALAGGTDSLAYGLLAHGDTLYAGGTFGRAGNLAANHVARWHGGSWSALGSGIDGAVADLAEFDGDLVAAGRFRGAGGVLSHGIARWNGSGWTALGAGLGNDIEAVVVFDGLLVAAAQYVQDAASDTIARVMRWDGYGWAPLGIGMRGEIFELIVHDGQLIAAGRFSHADEVPANNIARWTGTAWVPMGEQPLGTIIAMITHDQALVVAGYEPTGGGPEIANVARWDGQGWQTLGVRASRSMYSLAVWNGELIGGGSLATGDGGTPTDRSVFRWTGSDWSALPGLDRPTSALAIYNGDLVSAGGRQDGSDAPVSRWNGSSWEAIGDPVEQSVGSLRVYRGQLVAGGSFHRAGGLVSPFIAAFGPAQTTQSVISATVPSPSAPGQPVEISVQVTGVTAPTVGHVTLTGAAGGSCTDLALQPVSATTALVQCTIQWNRACPIRLVANYVGATDGNTTWQSSASTAFTHEVGNSVGCALSDLHADGFE